MNKHWVGIALLLSLLGCNKIQAGTVTHKEHQPAIEWVSLLPIGHTTCSGGKYPTCTTSYSYVPMYFYDDEDWAITIEACEDDKCRHRRVYVTEKEFASLKEGNWYRTPKDYKDDRDVKRKATREEQKLS